MILDDKKIFLPSVIVYRELKSNPNLLICSGEITLDAIDVISNLKVTGDVDDAEIIVPRNKSFSGVGYQRNGAWGMKDRKVLLESIDKGLGTNTYFMFYRGGTQDKRLVEVMDGANRLETQRAFRFDEKIRMPNGKKTQSLKVGYDNELEVPSTYDELSGIDKDKFNKHRIRVNLYFVLDKSQIDSYDEERKRFISDGVISLVENCVEISESTDGEIKQEIHDFCASQFVAFNKGKQNSVDENRRASPITSGYFSRNIDRISKEFNSNLYSLKIKRTFK